MFEGSAMLDERAVLKFANGLLNFRIRVHHDRPVPGDRLLDRLARYKQEVNAFIAGLYRYLVAGVEQHERTVAGALAHKQFAASGAFFLSEHAEGLRRAAESAGAREHVGKGVPIGFDLE